MPSNFFFFFLYTKMYPISVEGYENANDCFLRVTKLAKFGQV